MIWHLGKEVRTYHRVNTPLWLRGKLQDSLRPVRVLLTGPSGCERLVRIHLERTDEVGEAGKQPLKAIFFLMERKTDPCKTSSDLEKHLCAAGVNFLITKL
jgi:hypothetical protein